MPYVLCIDAVQLTVYWPSGCRDSVLTPLRHDLSTSLFVIHLCRGSPACSIMKVPQRSRLAQKTTRGVYEAQAIAWQQMPRLEDQQRRYLVPSCCKECETIKLDQRTSGPSCRCKRHNHHRRTTRDVLKSNWVHRSYPVPNAGARAFSSSETCIETQVSAALYWAQGPCVQGKTAWSRVSS
jgi:hypothetical protein